MLAVHSRLILPPFPDLDIAPDDTSPQARITVRGQLRQTIHSLQCLQHSCKTTARPTSRIEGAVVELLGSLLRFDAIFKNARIQICRELQTLIHTLHSFSEYCDYEVLGEMDWLSETLIVLSLRKFGKRVVGDVSRLADCI